MCHDCVEQRVVRTQKQTQGAKRVVLLWLSKDANTREKETNTLLTNKVKLNIRNMKHLRLRTYRMTNQQKWKHMGTQLQQIDITGEAKLNTLNTRLLK